MHKIRLVPRVSLALEVLEDRTVPTTATLTGNGVLTVLGTAAADDIHVSQTGGQIEVSGVTQTFATGSVNTVVIDSGDGNDTITVDANVTDTTWIYTGRGNDVVHGGGGPNHIYGGGGNDTLIGGSAQDVIYGGWGTSQITAPTGAAVFSGSANLTAYLSTEAQQILDLTNQFRAQNGLAPLTVNAQLTAAATINVNNMVSMVPYVGLDAAMNHTLNGVDQPTITSRLTTVGYAYYSAGENIAYGFSDANAVFQAWINSPGHLANILNPTFTQIGIAVAVTSSGVPYFAQEFGVPLTTTSTPVTTSPVTTTPVTTTPVTTTPVTTTPVTTTSTTGFSGGASVAGQIYAVGTDAGVTATVTVYDSATGAVKFTLTPFGSQFTGGARVTTANLNGDPDVIVAPGPGMAPWVEVYDGDTGTLIKSFLAYDSTFTGGVYVAAGDVDGDGHPDIITGAGEGGGPHVKVFDGQSFQVFRSFFAYSTNFTGGVSVAAGDVNGDGYADIITGAGPGGGPHVKVFDGKTGNVLQSFFAFSPTFTGGVYVAAGTLNNSGQVDIIAGAGASGGPEVRAFNGETLALMADFFASTPTFTGGVRVAAVDLTGNGIDDIVIATGSGNRTVAAYNSGGQVLASFLAEDPSDLGGLFVG